MNSHEISFVSANNMFLICICVGLIHLITAQLIFKDDDSCTTPNNSVGNCIPIKDCKPIIDMIETMALEIASFTNTLRQYQCGFYGKSVKVCCPSTTSTNNVYTQKNMQLLPSNCGIMNNEIRIYGGNKTTPFEFPFMALLSYNTGNGIDFKCAGTIINDRYILTAAHCITRLRNLKLLGVRVGEHNITSEKDCVQFDRDVKMCTYPVQDIAIAETIPHPDYDPVKYINDIGLIRLAWPINSTIDSVKPICLPITKELTNVNFTGQKLTVAGWGTTENGRKSAALLKIHIPVDSESQCSKAYENTQVVINRNHICAGGINADSCGGDSGGPLLKDEFLNDDIRYIQFGIVSFGPQLCGQKGFPGVYTRVDSYMNWIIENIRP